MTSVRENKLLTKSGLMLVVPGLKGAKNTEDSATNNTRGTKLCMVKRANASLREGCECGLTPMNFSLTPVKLKSVSHFRDG